MARKTDWTAVRDRTRIARQGLDSATDMGIPVGLAPPAARTSKASLRAQAAAAVASITRNVRCASCAHSASVVVPHVRRDAQLICSKCGVTTK